MRVGPGLLAMYLLGHSCSDGAQVIPLREQWLPLFNGVDLTGWTAKIAGHDVGTNYANTFRVEDGLIQVRYDGYEAFDDQFGHLFYDQPFSYYRLAVEYRFVGQQATGGPGWAWRNSGVMLHAQAPQTMPRDQDFPISIEVQFLGGPSDGSRRPTANVCTPGTEIVLDGQIAPRHCMESTSPTLDGDQWVRVEILVLGDSLIAHVVKGDTVLQYAGPRIGGGVVEGYDPTIKVDGTALSDGFISLQSESHPIDFRLVELLNLSGCTDVNASNFADYFVNANLDDCVYEPA